MPKGKDISEKLESRFVTQQKVEVQDPMQQLVQAAHPVKTDEATQERTQAEKQTDQHTGTQASKPVSTRTRVHARTHTQKEAIPVEALYEQIVNRKHLSSSTFRFQPEELQALEEVFTKLDRQKPGRLSRNDIARLGLIWLFEDFKQHGDESVLAEVHRRM